MIYYFIYWFFIVLLAVFSVLKRQNVSSFFLIYIVVVFFVGGRPVTLGTDTLEYYNIYEAYESASDGLEYGISGMILLYKFLGLSSWVWVLSLGALYVAPVLYVLYRLYARAFLVLFFLSSLIFWLSAINVVRQGVALSFFTLAVYFYFSNGRFSYKVVLAGFVSLGFHVSAIIPFLFLFLYKFFFFFSTALFPLLVVVVFASLVFDLDLLQPIYYLVVGLDAWLPSRFTERFYLYYEGGADNHQSIGFSYGVSFVVFVLSFYSIAKVRLLSFVNREFFIFSFAALSFFILLYPLVYKYSVFARVVLYFDFFSLFLICQMMVIYFSRKASLVLAVIISTIFFSKVVITGYQYGFLSDRF